MNDTEKVEFLFKEKEIARQEIFILNKTIWRVFLFALSPIFSIDIISLYSFYNGPDKVFSIGPITVTSNVTLLILSQIIFMLLMFHMSLVGNVAGLAGYVKYLEEKINHLAKDIITGWEGVIVEKYLATRKSTMMIAIALSYIVYYIAFCLTAYIFFKNAAHINPYCVVVYLFEICVLMHTVIRPGPDKRNTYELMKHADYKK